MSLTYSSLLGLSNVTSDYVNVDALNANTINISSLQASQAVVTDASKNLITLPYNATISNGGTSNIMARDSSGSTDLIGYLTAGGLNVAGFYTVNNTMTVSAINAIIANTAYSYILFAPGTYNISALFIARSNIVLDGNMAATLFMPNGTNNPNIAIGNLASSTPTIRYSDICVKNFQMNGNMANQTSEYMTGYSWVTNCNVFITYSTHVVIDNCDIQQSRSGGMTITYYSNDVVVENCTSYNHYFDNYTAYGSTNIRIANCYGSNCTNGGGISVDDNVQYMTIVNNTFVGNKLAVFARFCYDFVISSNVMSGNTQQGLFLSGYGQNPDQGPARWVISNNTITNNGSQGIYLQSCNYFTVNGNVICNNGGNGINIASDNGSYGVCSYCNFTGNTVCNNTGTGTVGFYNDSSNSYTAGARYNYLTMNIIKNNTAGQVVGDLTAWTVDDDTQITTSALNVNGNSTITGVTTLATANANSLILHNSGQTVSLTANPSGTCNFQFPSSGGTNGYFLQTDGSGNTSWVVSPSILSSAAVGAYYNSFTTLTLSGVSQNVPGLSATITLPTTGNYHIRADYVVNLESITLDSNVYCFASSSVAQGAGSGTYIQPFSTTSTPNSITVLTASGFLNGFGAGVVGVSPYSFTGGTSVTVNVKIYTSSSLSTNVTYLTGESDSSGAFWAGSNLVLSCISV